MVHCITFICEFCQSAPAEVPYGYPLDAGSAVFPFRNAGAHGKGLALQKNPAAARGIGGLFDLMS